MPVGTTASAGTSRWGAMARVYLKTMGLFLVHSTVAQAFAWTKFFLLCASGIFGLRYPWLLTVLLVWGFLKFKAYQASCGDLLPQWTEKGVALDQRLMKAVTKNMPTTADYFTNRDGLRLKYHMEGTGKKHVLICNGVNASWLLWKPVLQSLNAAFGRSWREELTVVTWDYRGLYESDSPAGTADFSVRALCTDGYDLLKHLQLEKWHCIFGWSTGVQAALEYAGHFPKTVDRLFLVNGSHGHTLRFAFQPLPQFFWIPLMSHILEALIWYVRFHVCADAKTFEAVRARYLRVMEYLTPTAFRLQAFLLSRASFEYTFASNLVDLFAHGPVHCNNVCRILQTLDCHSAVYNLPELKVPVLAVAGLLDFMTPAFTQYEIAALVPRAKLVSMAAGTHHCILEFPEQTSQAIADFLMADVDHLAKNWGRIDSRVVKVEWPIAWGLH